MDSEICPTMMCFLVRRLGASHLHVLKVWPLSCTLRWPITKCLVWSWLLSPHPCGKICESATRWFVTLSLLLGAGIAFLAGRNHFWETTFTCAAIDGLYSFPLPTCNGILWIPDVCCLESIWIGPF